MGKKIGRGRLSHIFLKPIKTSEPTPNKVTLIDKLEGTQYEIRSVKVETPQQETAHEIIMLSADISETLLRFGAGAQDVEIAIIAFMGSFGLKNIDIDITNQSVNINYAPPKENPIQVLRVTRSWTNNFMGLVQIHKLVTDVIKSNISLQEARDRVAFINKNPKPFPRWFANLAKGIFSASVVLTMGGSIFESFMALFTSSAVGNMMRLMSKYRLSKIYSISIASAFTTLIAGLAANAGLPLAPSLIIASGILSLLPAMEFVAAIRDAVTGYPVTASARSISVFLLFTGIVSGISIGLVLIERIMDLKYIDITSTFVGPPFFMHLILVSVASIAYGVTKQTDKKTLIPIFITSIAGYSFFYIMTFLHIGPRLVPFLSAVSIGIFANIIANRMCFPALVIYIPSMIPLLPGMMIFRASYNITIQTSSNGIAELISALMVGVGLGAGICLGDHLGSICFKQKKVKIN